MVDIPLENIYPNPWQTRLGDPDPEYITELANDIASNGLLQAPVGRFMSKEGEPVKVQLAFGHNRLEAFKLLAVADPENWGAIPVEIRELSDQELANFAWAENEKRRDVTPIERARAIQKRIEDFGWTQEMTANQLGISRSAVTNVLRLLKLPEGIQDQIQKGEMSERAAISLMGLFELPEELLQRARDYWDGDIDPDDIARSAANGASSEEIRKRINDLVQQFGNRLENARFGLDDEIPGENVRALTCRDCEARYAARNICLDEKCFDRKNYLAIEDYMQKASEKSGIPIVEDDVDYTQATRLDYYSTRDYLPTILQSGCENIRIRYSDHPINDSGSLKEQGYPKAVYLCKKRNGYCNCIKGLEAQERLERTQQKAEPVQIAGEDGSQEEPEYISDVAPAADTGPTAEELEELARQARKEKQEIKQRIEVQREKFIQRFADALLGMNPSAWKRVLYELTRYRTTNSKDLGKISREIGLHIANNNYPYDPKNIYEAVQRWNELLKNCNLEQLNPDEEETPEIPDKVQEILDTWQETQTWIRKIEKEPPTLEILGQKIQLLEALANAAGEVDDAWRDHLDPLYQDAALDELILRLYDLKVVLEHPYWSLIGVGHIKSLIEEGDQDFESSLQEAPLHILAYALALISGVEGMGLQAGKIRSQILGIQQKQELVGFNV